MQIETRRHIANLTSNILNPFAVSLVVILLLSFESTSNTSDALRLALLLIAISILPIFTVMLYLVRRGRLDRFFTDVRHQRTVVYLLAVGWAVIAGVIIICLGAPEVLIATFVAGLSAVVIFTCINLFWKISLHTAFLAASAVVLAILYWPIGMVSLVFLALMGWARIEAGHHSVAQVATGAVLAAAIAVITFCSFGLV
jgi:membrane-associated phospholipid phosphatase